MFKRKPKLVKIDNLEPGIYKYSKLFIETPISKEA